MRRYGDSRKMRANAPAIVEPCQSYDGYSEAQAQEYLHFFNRCVFPSDRTDRPHVSHVLMIFVNHLRDLVEAQKQSMPWIISLLISLNLTMFPEFFPDKTSKNESGTNNTKYCPIAGLSNNSIAWQEAAAYIFSGLDQKVDPCEDFYGFTCNKFLSKVNLTELKTDHFGTIEQAQVHINKQIIVALQNVSVNDDKTWSATERITKAALEACVLNKKLPHHQDASARVLKNITNWWTLVVNI
ncbi:hypothetical protein KIN20_033691 [Parelaphostrongylus tenuis]|uniref:Peptidase M13 N-terminal domain-containing protein n=1 Tax=Parelaphostrongylus tenuis TaxID=148309 RepID=A0AAD5WIG4_PARTN|nr:hypothetical protein KIN20_033691 [Parelaphostrongylus tenuis]